MATPLHSSPVTRLHSSQQKRPATLTNRPRDAGIGASFRGCRAGQLRWLCPRSHNNTRITPSTTSSTTSSTSRAAAARQLMLPGRGRVSCSAINGSRRPGGNGRNGPEDVKGPSAASDEPPSAYSYRVSQVLRQISAMDSIATEVAPNPKSTWELKDAKGSGNPWGELAYRYYNWRSGTASDILLVLVIVQAATLLFAVAYSAGMSLMGDQEWTFWDSIYRVISLFFQEQFPDKESSSVLEQVYSIGTATTGLLFFTILLAMIEQLFMEVLEERVDRGSVVREKDHVLVLGWNDSAVSLTAMWIVMQQVCEFYRPQGGTVIVVLSSESKTRMESLCAEFLPESKRHGSLFVFRQGSPLIPINLESVAAKDAKATIIVSDAARSPEEADAQSLRAAVLLDEMHGNDSDRRGRIIVELKTELSAQMMREVCSDYVFPISTYKINCARLARLVQRPITAYVSAREMCFNSKSQHFIHSFPKLVGTPFRELKYYFPDATAAAVLNVKNGTCCCMPLDDYVLQEGDEIDFLRDGQIPFWQFRPLQKPLRPDLAVDWTFEGSSRGSFDDRLETLESLKDSAPASKAFWTSNAAKAPLDSNSLLTVEEDEEFRMSSAGMSMEDALAKFSGSLLQNAESMTESMDEGADEESTSGPWNMTAWTSWDEEEMEEFNGQMRSTDENSAELPDSKTRVLIIGAAEDPFMAATIEEMDSGLCPLPPGSEVVLLSLHVPRFEGRPISEVYGCPEPENIKVSYTRGNPLVPADIEALPLESYSNIVVLVDKAWMDRDQDDANGMGATDTADMLRLDSMVMMVQIHVRRSLAKIGLKNTRFVTEKASSQGQTRFEDPFRLPIGSTLNQKDFAARFLAQVACQPKIMAVMAASSQGTNFELRDPLAFIGEGETMNYWALMEIVEDAGELLLGYVELPQGNDGSVDVVINPMGSFREVKFAWASRQLKLITTSRRQPTPPRDLSATALPTEVEEATRSLRFKRQRSGTNGIGSNDIKGVQQSDDVAAALVRADAVSPGDVSNGTSSPENR